MLKTFPISFTLNLEVLPVAHEAPCDLALSLPVPSVPPRSLPLVHSSPTSHLPPLHASLGASATCCHHSSFFQICAWLAPSLQTFTQLSPDQSGCLTII